MTGPATPLPNFFLAGVPKAGTTSLYAYLHQHPQIYLSPIKEPTFFGAEDISGMQMDPATKRAVEENHQSILQYLAGPMDERRETGLVQDWENYLKLFRNVRAETAIGEGSVSYIWLPSAAAALRARLPDARIILILRDPAERVFSHYLGALWGKADRSFRSRFLGGLEAGNEWQPVLEVGRYHKHLRRWFGYFPRDQVRVHLYEDYVGDPARVLRDLFEFLGVNAAHPVDFSRRAREPAVPRFPRLHAMKQALPLISRWTPAWLKRTARTLYTRPRAQVRLAPEDRQLVVDHYREEIRGTADLIGRDLSTWLR